MKRKALKEILHNVLATGRSASNGEVRASECPFCGSTTKEPFQINADTGFYHCFACGESGICPGFYPDPKAPVVTRPSLAAESHVTIPPPPGFLSLRDPDVLEDRRVRPAIDYLKNSRGVGLLQAQNLRIGCCLTGRYARRVIVPVLDAPDPTRWIGWIGRSWSPKARFPYTNDERMDKAKLFYREWLLSLDDPRPLFVVEGVFDAIHCGEAVAVFGKITEHQLRTLCGTRRTLILCFDGDAWYHGLYKTKQLRRRGVRAHSLHLEPTKDPDNYPRVLLTEAAELAMHKDLVSLEVAA
jgi:hypothetical protein